MHPTVPPKPYVIITIIITIIMFLCIVLQPKTGLQPKTKCKTKHFVQGSSGTKIVDGAKTHLSY